MADRTNNPSVPATNEAKPSVFDKDGAIGKQFTETGTIGGTAQKIGGPFDKDGTIGKQFTTKGSIGGTVQDNVDASKKS